MNIEVSGTFWRILKVSEGFGLILEVSCGF